MRVIIIGGVAAGTSAAAKFKRLQRDSEVVIYEKTKVPSFGACGLPYFVGNFFENQNNMISRTVEEFKKDGIDVFTEHEVLKINVNDKTVEVKNMQTEEVFIDNYDKLVISTGAHAITPPVKNINIKNIYQLKSMEDGVAIKELLKESSFKKIGIIGSGFIGLEVVEAAKQYDKEIHVFELNDRILSQVFDKEMSDILEDELISNGVNLHLSEGISEIIGTDRVKKVITNKGEYDIDILVVAAGVRPNTSFLKDTGIEMIKNGAIIIDNGGRTSIEDIFSAGDCATVNHVLKEEPAYIPLATNANKLGRIVGENLAGLNKSFNGALGSSCVKVLHLEAGKTGLTEKEAQDLGLNYKTVVISDMNQTSYYPGQSKITVKLIYNGETKVILGGQVVGRRDAVQRVNVLATAIFAKLTTEQLGMLDLCYAPPFSRTWDVLNVAGNVAK